MSRYPETTNSPALACGAALTSRLAQKGTTTHADCTSPSRQDPGQRAGHVLHVAGAGVRADRVPARRGSRGRGGLPDRQGVAVNDDLLAVPGPVERLLLAYSLPAIEEASR